MQLCISCLFSWCLKLDKLSVLRISCGILLQTAEVDELKKKSGCYVVSERWARVKNGVKRRGEPTNERPFIHFRLQNFSKKHQDHLIPVTAIWYRLPKHQTNQQSAGYEDSACSEVDRLCRNKGFVHSNSESDTSDEGELASKLHTWAVDRGVTNS